MGKEEYLSCLRRNLRNIPDEEIENIMEYYREYFEDAGEENEPRVIEELGKPEILAGKVSADYVIKDMENNAGTMTKPKQVKKAMSDVWIVLLAVFAFPLWFPLGIAAASVAFVILIVIVCFIFAIAVTVVALICSGVVAVVSGIALLFVHAATGITALGTGVLSIGCGALFLVLIYYVIQFIKIVFIKIGKIRVKKGVPKNE